MRTSPPTLTDLQRIELAFPAAAMLHVVDHGADTTNPRVRQVRRLLISTVDEALAGLAGREDRKLRARLDRTLRSFLAPLARRGGRVDIIGLVVWHVLAVALDADILVLPEGTPLSDALAALRPALQRATDDSQVATTVAREWPEAMASLQAMGLYGEVGGEVTMAA